MYRKALSEADASDIKYMVEEQQREIEELKKKKAGLQEENAGLQEQIVKLRMLLEEMKENRV